VPQLDLPPGWAWRSDWSVDTAAPDTDERGWSYGYNFAVDSFAAQAGRLGRVRRCTWTRTAVFTDSAAVTTATGAHQQAPAPAPQQAPAPAASALPAACATIALDDHRSVFYTGESLHFRITVPHGTVLVAGGYVSISTMLTNPTGSMSSSSVEHIELGRYDIRPGGVPTMEIRGEIPLSGVPQLLFRGSQGVDAPALHELCTIVNRFDSDDAQRLLTADEREWLRKRARDQFVEKKANAWSGADVVGMTGKGVGAAGGLAFAAVGAGAKFVRQAASKGVGVVAKKIGSSICSPANAAKMAFQKTRNPMWALGAAKLIGVRNPSELASATRTGILEAGGTESDAFAATLMAMAPVATDVATGGPLAGIKHFEGRARELAGLAPPPAREVPLDSAALIGVLKGAASDQLRDAKGTTEFGYGAGAQAGDALNEYFGLDVAKERAMQVANELLFELRFVQNPDRPAQAGLWGALSRAAEGATAYTTGESQNTVARSAPFFVRHNSEEGGREH
jgi:hypothetical protein